MNKCLNFNGFKRNLIFPFQVEAALTTDADNSELLTLKADLEQVIDLTNELISAQTGEVESKLEEPETNDYGNGSDEESYTKGNSRSDVQELEEANTRKRKYEEDALGTPRQPIKHWQVGEQCQALWSKDGQ